MPDRIIRDELLDSDRWLSLPSDTDRLAFIGLLLSCDDFGNLEGGLRRMSRLLQTFTHIKTDEAAATTLLHLADADLVRRYEHEKREFYHLPRQRPAKSYLVRKCPPSPWCNPDTLLGKHVRSVRNQGLAKNVLGTSPKHHKDVLQGVGVGVGVVEGVGVGLTPPPVDNSPPESPAPKPETLTQALKPLVETLTGKTQPRPQPRTREEQLAYVEAQTRGKA